MNLKEAIHEALELIHAKDGWLSEDAHKTLAEYINED